MARVLNRSPSSVSRELRKNFKRPGLYVSRIAHERALMKRKSRGRHERLKNEHIRQYVISHIKQGWSPEQISGRIRLDIKEKISHEAIYQYVYKDIGHGGIPTLALREDLRPYLRRKRRRRLGKGFRQYRIFRPNPGLSIDLRPRIVSLRRRLGDWEGDTVVSAGQKPGINTLVERKTGLVLITKLKDRTSASTVRAVADRFAKIPHKARRTLTLDNGPENTDWPGIEKRAGVRCYFAHPYHSWERGTNENTNGLIREYFPKKTDFGTIPEEAIAAIEHRLNTRPRKRLKYLTPLEAFSVALAD